jgi:methionyl-tRNA synthetase
VDPIEQIEKFGLDAVRYYSLAGIHTCLNGSWNEQELIDLYNSALADDCGNLVSRTIHLIDLKCCDIDSQLIDREFKSIVDEKIYDIECEWNALNISKGIELTNALFKFGNKYINNAKPWGDYYETPLNNLFYLIQKGTDYLEPVIPDSCNTIRLSLSSRKKAIVFPKLGLKLETT